MHIVISPWGSVGFDKNIVYFGGYNAVEKEHYGDIFILNTGTAWPCGIMVR